MSLHSSHIIANRYKLCSLCCGRCRAGGCNWIIISRNSRCSFFLTCAGMRRYLLVLMESPRALNNVAINWAWRWASSMECANRRKSSMYANILIPGCLNHAITGYGEQSVMRYRRTLVTDRGLISQINYVEMLAVLLALQCFIMDSPCPSQSVSAWTTPQQSPTWTAKEGWFPLTLYFSQTNAASGACLRTSP